jgi:hypothetical protein
MSTEGMTIAEVFPEPGPMTKAVFLSSGVSGGSLGLVVADVTAEPADAINELTRPDALAKGAGSMLTGDLVLAFTGCLLVRSVCRLGSLLCRGTDRAAQLEMTWEEGSAAVRSSRSMRT